MSGIKTDTSGREVYNLDTSGSGGGAGGSVTIDQSTPGTTNGVVVNSGAVTATGNVASGVSDAGNPVKAGAKYNSTLPTFTDGQRGDLQMGARGSLNVSLMVAGGAGAVGTVATLVDAQSNAVTALYNAGFNLAFNGTTWDRMRGDSAGLLTQQFALSGSRWSYAAAAGGITNTTTAVTIAAAAGAGLRNYLTGMQIFADTLGTATEIVIRDGAAGTVLWRGKINTGGSFVGAEIKFSCPLKGTANTLMEFATLTASGTGSVYVNAQGYTAA